MISLMEEVESEILFEFGDLWRVLGWVFFMRYCFGFSKSTSWVLVRSIAIILVQIQSVSDVVLSGVALWSFKVARAPKDKEHPYGVPPIKGKEGWIIYIS
ncbi:hypothetical protein IFM89_011813 [Coptis chinensis]|uniref:Cation efflux protein transmembrane domain-containing protein n=1 Tax=Coptis chinensis TaxID=261450 RepID=A0A835H7N7_9MAGN|nr:hypothetical protein IFM89_011813 [Coptis chinensis]